jgi:transcriptional regulator with XRE-family HTH domain
MLTPYGVAARKLRLDRGLRLLDLADALGVTDTFVSAVETGKKPIPKDFVAKVSKAIGLSPTEERELERAADRTRQEVSVAPLSGEKRELVAEFARRIDSLPPDLLRRVKRAVYRSSAERPFERVRPGLLVPPMSTATLRQFAEAVRTALSEDEETAIPIMDILEFRLPQIMDGFHIQIESQAEMGPEEGRMAAGANSIVFREDVYRAAWRDDGRARFTACHELAHFLLHREIRMARARGDGHPVYRDSEWQADTFAGTLLMSPRHLKQFQSIDDAARRCKMTPHAAGVMWFKYRKEGLL